MSAAQTAGLSSLVTGGCGAIGSQLCRRLLERGDEVVVLDDLSSGFRENLPEGVELVVGDIADKGVVKRLFDGAEFQTVFHLAALFANQNSVEHPDRDLQVNGLGTLNLLQCAADHSALLRFLYVSSSCVYGGVGGAITEETDFDLETPYAISKLLGEQYVEFYRHHASLSATVVRLFNCYGPGERPGRYRNVIPNFIWRALHNEPLFITGTGEETRDFTFVADTVDGIVRAAAAANSAGRVYNIGSGRETTIRELAEQIVAVCASSSPIVISERRSWDRTQRRLADISRAREDIGYEPRTGLREGIAITVDWFRSWTEDVREHVRTDAQQ